MNRILLVLFIVLSIGFSINAQTVSGRVFEIQNNNKGPLIGATIKQENTTNGVVADENGQFVLELIPNKSYKIIVSFVGYENDTIDLTSSNKTDLVIIMNDQKILGEVVVKGRRKGSSISRTKTRSIVNINENELQKAACCNLSESFENSATVDVSYSDAITGAKQIQMLGLSGIYTQLLTENIPNMRGLSTPWGLGYIPGSWMSSIQVSKGTSSVINGNESMAGQINVELKKSNDGEIFFLNLYGNQMGKMEGNSNVRFNLSDKWSTAILAHVEDRPFKQDQNGDSFIDAPLISQINLFNRYRYINNAFRMQLGVKYLSENRKGGQMTFDADKPHSIENGYGIGVKTNRVEGFLKIGIISKNKDLTNIGLQNQFVIHNQTSFFGLNIYDAKQFSYYGNYMFQSYFASSKNQYTTGISIIYDDYNEVLNDSTFGRSEISIGSFFQYTYSNYNNLNIIAGIRLDNNNIYGLLFTPRLHLKYNINEQNAIRIGAGKGYRSPNLIAENTSLLATSKKIIITETPEIESSWNYGISYTSYIKINARELTITADYFRTQFINQIVVDRDNDPFIVYMYNLDGVSFSNSFQIETSYELFKNLEAKLAFRYNDVKTTISDKLIEKPLMNKFKGLLAVSYQTPYKKWQFDLNIQAIGNQRLPNTEFNPPQYQLGDYAPNYALINLQITRYIKNFDVYIGAENIGNYRQTNPIISSEDPFGEYFDSSIIWGPISGIIVYGGIRFRINPEEEE
jgi:outer membrane receptor for ferrienterochelin and colicins